VGLKLLNSFKYLPTVNQFFTKNYDSNFINM
jgi:hypothetical protein